MNIFLTGRINCGKSTLIKDFKAFYKGSLSGFKTIRIKTELDDFFGVYLLDINDDECKTGIHNKAGDCYIDKSLVSYKKVFDTVGVELLNRYQKSDLVIMDELGVLEKNSSKFISKIKEILDSDINVIGVIKKKDSPFLNDIRQRKDVTVIEVTGENNKEILEHLINVFCR